MTLVVESGGGFYTSLVDSPAASVSALITALGPQAFGRRHVARNRAGTVPRNDPISCSGPELPISGLEGQDSVPLPKTRRLIPMMDYPSPQSH